MSYRACEEGIGNDWSCPVIYLRWDDPDFRQRVVNMLNNAEAEGQRNGEREGYNRGLHYDGM